LWLRCYKSAIPVGFRAQGIQTLSNGIEGAVKPRLITNAFIG
jgi:hypothetical protein